MSCNSKQESNDAEIELGNHIEAIKKYRHTGGFSEKDPNETEFANGFELGVHVINALWKKIF